jgi:PAS domain S-box-containing protein
MATAALIASDHAFSVADAKRPDVPIVWVNPAFERLTGYSLVDVRGRNCRLLQGADTDRRAVRRIRRALAAGVPVTETLLNYRDDGSSWWNQVTISPVRDTGGALTHFVGVQTDVGDLVEATRLRVAAEHRLVETETQSRTEAQASVRALQESLLPTLPEVPGLELAARYLPASGTAEVGGDWFDVLLLPDGSTGIAIGDVMGHDIHAAAAMGQLRSVLRSYAWQGQGPAEVLDRVNRLVWGMGVARFATCIYARVGPTRAGHPIEIRWSNAGHPPPLLRTPDGTVQILTGAVGAPIGAVRSNPAIQARTNSGRTLPAGSTLLFYTDGLIEDRSRDIDLGIARLAQAMKASATDIAANDLVDHIIATAGQSTHQDDQCLLVVRAL